MKLHLKQARDLVAAMERENVDVIELQDTTDGKLKLFSIEVKETKKPLALNPNKKKGGEAQVDEASQA